MRSLKLLLWQFLSPIVLPACGSVLALLFGPVGLAALVNVNDLTLADTEVPRTFFLSYVGVAVFCFNAIIWGGLSDMIPRSRLLPCPSRLLATFFLLAPAFTIMILNAAVLLGYRYLFGGAWPVTATCLGLGVTTMIGAAGVWWVRDASLAQAIAFPLAFALWGLWVASRIFSDGFRQPAVLWRTVTLTDAIICSGIVVATWLVSCRGYRRYRHGIPRAHWLNVLYESQHEFTTVPADVPGEATRSDSPAETLLAMIKARTRITALAATASFCIGFAGLIFMILQSDRRPLSGMFMLTTVFGIFAGVMVGLTLGAEFWISQPRNPNPGRLRTYLATLPFSDQQLGRILLRSLLPGLLQATVCLLVALGVGVAIHTAVMGPTNFAAMYRSTRIVELFGGGGGLIPLLAIPLVIWTAAGNISGCAICGNKRWIIGLTSVLPMTFVLMMWLYNFAGSTGERIADVLLPTLSISIFSGALWLIRKATRSNLITRRQMQACFVALAAVACVVWILTPYALFWKVVAAGFSSLAVTPVPGIPLALAANRHA